MPSAKPSPIDRRIAIDSTPPPDRKPLTPAQIAALKNWLAKGGNSLPPAAATPAAEVAGPAAIDASLPPSDPVASGAVPASGTTPEKSVPAPEFPAIDDGAAPWFPTPQQPVRPRSAPAAPLAPVPLMPARDPEADRRLVDGALETLCIHLTEMAKRLNQQRPMIERSYDIGFGSALGGLQWKEGYVQRQSAKPGGDGAGFALHCVLTASGEEVLKVPESMFKTTAEQLLLLDLAVTGVDRSAADVAAGQASFSVLREVRVRLRFAAQYETGCVVLEARNLDGVGTCSYWIAPEVFDERSLAQIEQFIIGRRRSEPEIFARRKNA